GLYTSGRGSSAAGLCVAGESKIFLSNGIHPISEIVENEFQHGEIFQHNEKINYTENNGNDLQVFHSKNLKLEFQPIERFWKINSPRKLIRIASKTGRKLELTQETSVLSLDQNSGLVWKPAGLLRPRERVAMARTYSIESLKEVPSIYELIKDYPGKLNLSNVSKAVQFLVEKIINKGGITKRSLAKKLGISEATLYRWLDDSQPGTISLIKLQQLARLANENVISLLPEELYLEIKRGQTIVLQQKLNEDWFYIMGLIFGDGRISIDKRESGYGGVTIGLCNRDHALLSEFKTFFENLGLKASFSAANSKRPSECRVWSKLIYHIFSKFGLCPSPKSSHINPNPEILCYSQSFLYAFLRGLFDADGWIFTRKSGSSHIGFSSTSYDLVSFVQNALLTIGIVAYIRKRKPKTTTLADGRKIKGKHAKYELTFRSYSDFISFNESIGFFHPKKRESLQKYCQIKKSSHRNDDNIPGAMQLLKELIDFYYYNAKEIAGYKSAFAPSNFKMAMSRERLSAMLNKLDLDWHRHRVRIPYNIRNRFYQEIRAHLSETSFLGHSKLSKSQLYDYFIREKRNLPIPVGVFHSLLAKTSGKLNQQTKEYWSRFLDGIREQHENQLGKFELLKRLCNSDIFWDEITNVEKIDSQNQFVYDLTIPQTHNFIVNGFVTHNTAAVMRDPDSGEMTLEAGALVLADLGLAAIDEFDKMRTEDRSAIHEALEQHTVSIAKAGIVATLNARASVLAAANPRDGRWDPWKDPAYNINLPPTLLSRFDLIFPLTDQPDEVEDERKSEHILRIHQARSLEVEPPLSIDLLKKYISYARQQPAPVLSDDAIARLHEFYLDLRKRGVVTEKDAEPIPVPITPRQLEALIRLAEARARMELRTEVLPEDAVAAIRLLTATMEALAIDLETGVWDSDRATTGISTRTRGRQSRLRGIIDGLAAEHGMFSLKQIIQKAEKDIPNITESEIVDFVEFLKREGKLYEPQTEQYRKASR
ncbi:MAG: LAGLIDADG family homing endonuclease, partial [Candidatus Thorarchaeota archaeon]